MSLIQQKMVPINPIKAGGLYLCLAWGGVWRPPPLRKRYWVEMHVHSSVFQGQLIEKKIDR